MRNALLIASNTFRDAMRQKLLLLIVFIAAILAGLSKYMLRFDLGHEKLKFVFDFGSGAMTFFGALIAVTATCQLIHSELDNRTIITLLSKPVNFVQLAFGKLLGVCGALAVFAIIVTAVTCLMLAITEFEIIERAGGKIPEGLLNPSWSGIACWALIQWFKLATVASVACAICAASSSLMFSVITSFMVLAATMARSANIWFGSDENLATQLTGYILPNFEIFAKSDLFAFAGVNAMTFAATIAYSCVYIAACCGLASWLFSKREF